MVALTIWLTKSLFERIVFCTLQITFCENCGGHEAVLQNGALECRGLTGG